MATAPWRLIVAHNAYADFSVSVSPAVEKAVIEGTVPPTVFLDIFDVDSVTVGVNEDPVQVLDLDFCRARESDFRRRVNGGGVVYAGAGPVCLYRSEDNGVTWNTLDGLLQMPAQDLSFLHKRDPQHWCG